MYPEQLDEAVSTVYEAGMGEAKWVDAMSALGAPFPSRTRRPSRRCASATGCSCDRVGSRRAITGRPRTCCA